MMSKTGMSLTTDRSIPGSTKTSLKRFESMVNTGNIGLLERTFALVLAGPTNGPDKP
jgi:hypothetical protein